MKANKLSRKEKIVRNLLVAIDKNPSRHGLRDTPKMVVGFENTTFSICCVPCNLKDGFYTPVHDSILTDILGKVNPHPILDLKKSIDLKLFEKKDINQIIILIDDLDVIRNWILPIKYSRKQLNEEIQKFIFSYKTKIKDKIRVKIDICKLSRFLHKNKLMDLFNNMFCESCQLIKGIVEQKQVSSFENKEIGKVIAVNIGRRKSFYKKVRGYNARQLNEASVRVKILEQSINHLANYMAQGLLMTQIRPAGYILLENSEKYLMSLHNPEFSKLILNKNG